MQDLNSKNEALDPRVYYQSLSKKERGQFLRYLLIRHDYNTRTMSYKLTRPDSLLRRDEKENVLSAIESGAWRA